MNIDLPKCLVCEKAVKHKKNKTCSAQCREELKKQSGSAAVSHEKKRQTLLSKYGVENPAYSPASQKKRLKTLEEKYGAKSSPLAREKAKNRSVDLNRKGRQTLREKYGVENPAQLTDHREKCVNTLLQNYGVTNYFNSDDWQNKSLEKALVLFQELSPKFISIIEIAEPDEYLIEAHTKPNKRIKFTCNKCGNTEAVASETFKFRLRDFKNVCSFCLGISRLTSAGEKEVVQYIRSVYTGTILENDRKLIYRKELDIVLPDINLAFEYNGIFYHSNKRIHEPKYHLDKLERCNKIHLRLINIFEDEWLFKKEIVKKRIRYLLGLEKNKIYARHCVVQEISSNEARSFIENEHIHGYVNAKIKLGLFHNGQLVSVMTLSRPNRAKGRHSNFDTWEISRFCSTINVVGGASKLLSSFKKRYMPPSIFTYSDRRWDTGQLYSTLGFTFVGNTTPGYWYVKGDKRYHRFALRKNKDDDLNLTEWENRQRQGWHRIWDCGHAKWVWKAS
ncbi:MAG: hypothetical protein HC836_23160 [Richelia sp. RM2_1_2]|nr:hypothetical protein [Richelia sp. RM2_1_2]